MKGKGIGEGKIRRRLLWPRFPGRKDGDKIVSSLGDGGRNGNWRSLGLAINNHSLLLALARMSEYGLRCRILLEHLCTGQN